MKKIITLILALVMILALVGCEYLPDDLQDNINGIIGSIVEGITPDTPDTPDVPDTPAHEHDFKVTESKKAYCAKDGYAKYKCQCGETKEEVIPALGHDMQPVSTKPTCIKAGTEGFACTRCSKTDIHTVEALGHDWGELVENSRVITCTRKGCTKSKLADGNGKYEETLAFTFGDDDKAALEAKHNELAAILESADKYDPALHGYAETGELADKYAAAEALYEEYSDLIFDAQGQYSIAMTLYYCNHRNADLEKRYNDMQNYYTDLVAKFYSLSQPWYDSMFREFFFYGATEEEINAFLFDSNALADPEYTALKNRNDEIELEFNNISKPETSLTVPELYAEFVANNNAMAIRLGYKNYLEYAYENVYDRDYTYEEASVFVDYVKEYIVPIYNNLYGKWNSITSGNLSEEDINAYYEVVSNSFFSDIMANKLFNDYIDDMNMAFTSNPDKQISFSDCLNDLIVNGNLFRGSYEGAYVTYVRGANLPIAYFGSGYDSATTVAHEFGHYMNEIYNDDQYSQSFDLLETHSQGQEMLFIQYVRNHLDGTALELVETYNLLSTVQTIMLATQVTCFEQTIYLDYYDGPGAEAIMADGTITSDEYDDVYAGLSEYFGINEANRVDEYWRYVTISSPCYYISYAISGVNALQIYAKANGAGYEDAKQSYLKLFTYTDVDPEMTDSMILEYAGLHHYTEEDAYITIYKALR